MALTELDQSIHKPNILNYGEKDYPEQLRFHRSTARGRFISGGNRGGKTDAEVVEAIWWATNTHPYLKRPESWGLGPLQLRFVVVDIAKGVEQIILPKMKRWLPKSYLIEGNWDRSWDAKNLILTLENGSTIDFVTWGMDMMKLGGVPRHIMFFDEEPPQNIFNESMMRLLDYAGMWVIAATPSKGMGWTYDLLWEPSVEGEITEIETFTLSAEQNPYIEATAEDMNFYTLGMDKEEREVREKGTWVARSGLIFPTFAKNLDLHTIDHIEVPRGWARYASADFGLNNPTAWLWHAVGPNGDVYTFGEHYKSEMIVAEHSAIIKSKEAAWGIDSSVIERMGDPAGRQRNGVTGTSYVQEYALNGIYINVEGIPHEVMIGIEKMWAYMRYRQDSYWGPGRPKWVISKACVNLIRELKKLRWATYASDKQAYETNKQELVHKKDDHAFDSTRYFFTTRPDLSPQESERTTDGKPVTVSYEELMLRLRQDPLVEFVEEDEHESWETIMGYSEESYVG